MDNKQTDNKGEEIPPIILVDNNVIQHFLSKDLGKQLEPILQEIENMGAILATSQIVVYEALKAIVFDAKKYKTVEDFFVKFITRYPVSEDVLVEAARVHEIYGSDKASKGRRDGFSTEDVILATTSMLLGAYIITCDGNDFPIPFFKEQNREIVYYQENKKRKHIVIYLLYPDADAIQAALNKLNPPIYQKEGRANRADSR